MSSSSGDPVVCTVFGCTTSTEASLPPFHPFPLLNGHPTRTEFWLQFCGQRLDVRKHREWRMCSRHFDKPTFMPCTDGNSAAALFSEALPTEHPPPGVAVHPAVGWDPTSAGSSVLSVSRAFSVENREFVLVRYPLKPKVVPVSVPVSVSVAVAVPAATVKLRTAGKNKKTPKKKTPAKKRVSTTAEKTTPTSNISPNVSTVQDAPLISHSPHSPSSSLINADGTSRQGSPSDVWHSDDMSNGSTNCPLTTIPPLPAISDQQVRQFHGLAQAIIVREPLFTKRTVNTEDPPETPTPKPPRPPKPTINGRSAMTSSLTENAMTSPQEKMALLRRKQRTAVQLGRRLQIRLTAEKQKVEVEREKVATLEKKFTDLAKMVKEKVTAKETGKWAALPVMLQSMMHAVEFGERNIRKGRWTPALMQLACTVYAQSRIAYRSLLNGGLPFPPESRVVRTLRLDKQTAGPDGPSYQYVPTPRKGKRVWFSKEQYVELREVLGLWRTSGIRPSKEMIQDMATRFEAPYQKVYRWFEVQQQRYLKQQRREQWEREHPDQVHPDSD